ncbi:MAG: hypothetical protein AAFR58_09150 [Cyanobacteria bacterium J06627_28]
MKRFALSAFSVLLATAAIAPVAQAAPTLSSDFNIQTLRLQEFDARSKSEETSQSYDYDYPQSDAQTWTENAAAEQDSTPAAEPTAWEAPESEAEAPALSLIERRQQALDERS